ncbi:type VII secretion protein EccCa [Nocardioides lianchengensis]|uniref:DNA segregation ATPase FtsK/SpoIIIE, S-DNA-T family n=1 Tax=Nocardioides lianchengensis TaxID=1045774 RepID=A0A1G6Q6J7_9ACTN|nr:type VII secretion protein EccCa [Nocardioides lianchengensis]NYG12094.1 S-DNA-T family DNA segregation ATPase FtsK/SpoIIIE [Nocardioides lianchengensis]SDC87346.1 DNA segregation ATPase FtsK/SpoIIIE, S-DNA-T family [Nocardioides lianchengensis]
MSTTLRRTRLDEPELPTGQIVLQAPPEIQPHEGAGGVLMNAIPMLGSLGSIVLVATMGSATAGRSYIAAGMFLFATLGFIVVQIDRQRKQRTQQVTGSRTEYLRYLANVRKLAREAADQQRRALTWHHPDPSSLPSLAEERSRLWEHGASDERFLQIRYGLCHQPLSLELVPPESAPIDQVDPAAASALHRLLVVHRLQPDLPASIDLRAFDRVEVCGPEEPVRSLARALICSATAFHSPEHLVVAVLASDQTLAHWDWVKWLPHAASPQESDAVGPRRMVSTSLAELASLLPPDLGDRPRFGADERQPTPHILLVTDGAELPPGNHVVPPDGLHGVTVLDLPTRWDALEDSSRLRLQVEDGEERGGRPAISALRLREEPIRARADQCDLATAEAFARRLAPLHTVTLVADPDSTAGEIAGPTDFMDLLALGDVRRFDPGAAWRPRPARDRLRVPIGLGEGGALVHLDIKESAQQGMGPHGLVIGATGSGKSEFLRTLVLGLTMTHSPEQLNLVLVDFKGGATFAGMSELPHVSAVITNLAQELTLVDRMQDALSGEMVRRQELLREAGNFASVRDYERARTNGEDLAPLPSLFIVVDEFSELLTAKPEFIDLFVAIGRLGRSLGLHLLLASQRLEEGRLRGLESHLSYRIGLRTFSAQESRAVLGVPDAYELPPVPGLGYLKPDPTTMLRFKAAYVSGPPSGVQRVRRDDGGHVEGILPFTIAEVLKLDVPEPEPEPVPVAQEQDDQASLLDIAVERMEDRGPAAHQVWLPPLDVPDTLDRLMGDLAPDPELGLISQQWRRVGGLTVPLGIIDRPREQRRDTLSVDLSGAAGHVAVVGGPRSGKSTLLRTVVTSMSLTTTPLESQFFVLDFGGGTFAPLAKLPHVAGVGTRAEPDVVRRVMAEVQGIVDRREAYFRAQGIDSIETYRSRRARGRADDGWGDVFLVVDGWSTLRADFDDLEMEIQQLAARGLTFGLHVVAGASRWADFRAAMRDVFGTRLELRLGDAMDSEVDRKAAALVPTGRPGRGLIAGKLHILAALPRIDGVTEGDSLGDGVDDLIARVTAAWQGPAGPKLRLLPERIGLERIRELAGVPTTDDGGEKDGGRLLVGIDEKELAPVSLDPDAEPHLLVFGDGQSGKSSLLRSYVHEVMRTRTPKQAQLVVVDYRRSLLGEVPEEYLLNYLTSASQAGPALKDLAAYLENRLPGPDVTPDQLRNRSWWSGAEVFVVVDDYDLVATQQSSPVQVLQPLMAQGRDTGLHVVVARRSGGASRALYEPVIQSMRDLAMPGLLLSGAPDEGPLIGNLRPSPAPPGRGRLVTRERGLEVVQTAWTEPSL